MPGPWEKYSATTVEQESGPWQKYQVPVPPTGIPEAGPSQAGQDVRGIGSALLDVGKKGALPMAGSIALPAAATAALGPLNAPFIPLEQGIGSGLGEAANQALGITEPSLKQIGIATAAPIATGYGMNLLRTGKALPKTLNTEGPGMALNQIKGYRGEFSAAQMMDDATRQGVTVPLNKTTQALQDMRNVLANKTPAQQRAFEKVLKDTGLENLATGPGGISPAKMQGLLETIGPLQAAADDGIEKGYLGKFFATLNQDLDDAGAALGPARDYWKREKVLDDVEAAISKAIFTPKGQGLDTQFNANKIINELNNKSEGLGKWFSQSFTVAEQGELKNMLGFLNTLPSLKPTSGQWGSGRFWERASHSTAGGGIGAGIGFSIAGPPGAAVGAGIGVATPEALDFVRLAMQAWKMPGGKQVVKQLLLNTDSAKLPLAMSSLTAFLSGAAAKSPKPVQTGTMLMPFGNEQ